MGDLQAHLNAYVDIETAVIGVGGQWPREVRRYAERHNITFPLLIDRERAVIKNYGVYHWLSLDAYHIARPSTFVIDKAGIIRFIYVGSHQFDLVKHEDLIACLAMLAQKSP
ncbi:peroxiredoxin family protein [Candidatus Poribacteria bacterium]|nr:peroxiredoxin family protein [Candidatus Poribacteria bacterium]